MHHQSTRLADLPATTRQEQKTKTRARMLQAALDAFAQHGFQGTSIRDIAARAGVNHALVKYHYTDKENLWKAAVTFLFERLEAWMADDPAIENAASELDRMKAWIRRYVRYCAHHPEHARIMVQTSLSDGARLEWAASFIRREHAPGIKHFNENKSTGLWPDVPNVSLIYILVAACQTLFMLAPEVRHVHDIDVLSDAAIDAHADAVITLFFEHSAR